MGMNRISQQQILGPTPSTLMTTHAHDYPYRTNRTIGKANNGGMAGKAGRLNSGAHAPDNEQSNKTGPDNTTQN